MRPDGEHGYALVAAVASIFVFASMALTILSATRTVTENAAAEQAQLQASAAADAGFALALSKLLSRDATGRWGPDGRARHWRYGDARLVILMEDERGKVPINGLNEALATRLLEEAGLGGERLSIARDSLLDWEDGDEDVRPFGAERSYYRATDIVPANGFLSSMGELARVRGFDSRTIDRLKVMASSFTQVGAFDSTFAMPHALSVMQEAGGKDVVVSIERARELAGQNVALAFTDAPDLAGRSVTIRVEATLDDGVRMTRNVVVQLTGVKDMPYTVIASD